MDDLTPVRPVREAPAQEMAPLTPEQKRTARIEARIAARKEAARPRRIGADEPSDNDELLAFLPRIKSPSLKPNLLSSFILFVLVPTLFAAFYYFAIASNQYVSEFRFAVRSQGFSPAGSTAASTALNGAARGEYYADNFLVVDYIQSQQAVIDIMERLDLRAMFARADVDPWSRLDEDASSEAFFKYWRSKVSASFDMATGLASVKVKAFTPDDAYQIATTLVGQSEKLINEITARSRLDAVQFAENDVHRAEERLRGARVEMRKFRDLQQTPDAAKTAGGTLDLAMTLRAEVAGLQSQLASLRSYMDENAPSVKVLESRIAATTKQINTIERELGRGGQGQPVPAQQPTDTAAGTDGTSGANPALSDILSAYEDVDLSRQFAEKYYDTTLTTLELARSQAATQQTYVATYVQPSLSERSEYPNRLTSTGLIFLACAALWFIGVMLVYSIRDHAA